MKWLKLEWMFFKLSIRADLQQPVNLLIHFFNDILWYSVQIALFEAVYLHIDSLGGWHIEQMRVFLGLIFLVDAIQMVIFSYNFDHFNEHLARGDLDFAIMKPISTQWLMTSKRKSTGYLLNTLFAACWLTYALTQVEARIPLLLLVIPLALACFYSIRVFFATLSLFFTQSESFTDIFYSIFRLGLRPDRLYTNAVRYFVLLLFPVGMIASMPARILLDSNPLQPLLTLAAVAVSSLLLTHLFFKRGIKRYSSL